MNMTSKIVAIASLAMVAGCAMPRTSGVWVEKGRLNIEDPAFAANIKVINVSHEKTPEGFLHAQVEVENTNRTDYKCQYRFEWIRIGGMTQKHSEMSWSPITLQGRTPTRLEGACTVRDADQFRFFIRRAD